ncbi:MAG TPA: hypothetical protein PKZ76_02005 [Xanthomonadaceae bacterium]|nr:hypothetical protein [Xanthomonadaceae bacterium]
MRMLLLLVPVVLGACEMTVFRDRPIDPDGACPEALVGAWQGEEESQGPGFYASIDENCGATLRLLEGGDWRSGQARLFVTDGHVFVAVADVRHLLDGEDEEVEALPEGYFGWRMQVVGDTLHLAYPDHRHLAHLIIDGRLRGRVHKDRHLVVEVAEPAQSLPDLLQRRDLFGDRDVLILQRIPALPELP